MTLYNLDGTPYELSGSLVQYGQESGSHDLFDLWDQEAIKQGGSPVFYHEVIISPQSVDPVYLEARGKLFSKHPVQLWAAYDPVRSQNMLSPFGVDSPDEIKLELNYKATLEALNNKLPVVGSIIKTPHLKEYWEIVQRNSSEFKLWGVLRLELICKRFQETLTTGDGKVTQQLPDVKIKIV